MKHILVICNFFVVNLVVIKGISEIFDNLSMTAFYSRNSSNYFGYSVVLSKNGLLVGAPKATRLNSSTSSGDIYTCEFSHLDYHHINCAPVPIKNPGFLSNDMWFGASIDVVAENQYIFCAPRWADKTGAPNGACYLDNTRQKKFLPMNDTLKIFYDSGGARKNYQQVYGNHRLNFYRQGLVGMSVKVTENNKVIVGAPGLMMWTGGIIEYQLNPAIMKRNPTNPYFTEELGPDEYFGYSVESGVFEVNGSVLYVAGAPRSKMGYGQVFVFEPPLRAADPLHIRAKVQGPQLGSYFGASLCCTDLNGDGKTDLLVGAPNFVTSDSNMYYNQGAVFVYLTGGESLTLVLEEAGFVSGSAANGAYFGSAIAALGDVDSDGFNDIAVGAPWENNGVGAVYIYRGGPNGLEREYSQRIQVRDAKSFGFSISRGVDVDGNYCNDLAVGAPNIATAYIFRCIPSIQVNVSIIVPNNDSIHHNSSKFTAFFCVTVKQKKILPDIKIDFLATITIDGDNKIAFILGESEFNITFTKDVCYERVVEIIRPSTSEMNSILVKFELEEIIQIPIDTPITFKTDETRLAKDSNLNTSLLIKLVCENVDDCAPWFQMSLEPSKKNYIPGTNDRLLVQLMIFNIKGPTHGVRVFLFLPLLPKRVPRFCSLEGLKMTCALPSSLLKGDSVCKWEIELEYSSKVADKKAVMVTAELDAPNNGNKNNAAKNVTINITPIAHFRINGLIMPEAPKLILNENLNKIRNISFIHHFEIVNLGPSDCHDLKATISLPKNVILTSLVPGCQIVNNNVTCAWVLPANISQSLALPLIHSFENNGQYLKQRTSIKITTMLTLLVPEQQSLSLTTTIHVLRDPLAPFRFYFYIAASVSGILLFSAISLLLDMCGFFKREHYEKLKELKYNILEEKKSVGRSSLNKIEIAKNTDDFLSNITEIAENASDSSLNGIKRADDATNLSVNTDMVENATCPSLSDTKMYEDASIPSSVTEKS